MGTLRTVIKWDGECIHLNQLIRQERGRYYDDYVVVDIRDGEIKLADPDFENAPRTVSEKEWREGDFEAMAANGVPVWAY